MYRTLCTSNIRLLTLLPGCVDNNINIILESVELTSSDKPNYEALSYTWGTSAADTELHVIQDNEFKSLTITKSLATALQHLRNEHHSRRLWIDAVCINQEDTGERSSQVARMADIFRSAAKVIIWLGPESEQRRTAAKYKLEYYRLLKVYGTLLNSCQTLSALEAKMTNNHNNHSNQERKGYEVQPSDSYNTAVSTRDHLGYNLRHQKILKCASPASLE